MINKMSNVEKAGFILVLLMVLLQGFYGVFAFIEPSAFATVRGTELFAVKDSDWVRVYGSRTIFITLVFGYLLFTRNYVILKWSALFGVIMPITDGFLAYEAQAPLKVVFKHIATVVYLLLTFFVLKTVVGKKVS